MTQSKIIFELLEHLKKNHPGQPEKAFAMLEEYVQQRIAAHVKGEAIPHA